jgi:hypothetical protein
VYSEEKVELLHLKLKHLLQLKIFTVIGQMPLVLLMAIVRKSLNLISLEIDSDDNIEGGFLKIFFILQNFSYNFFSLHR